MANEARLIIETGKPIMMKCADATGIEKGAILQLTDPMTASLADGTNQTVAGICSGEKIASNGTLYVGVYREGFAVVKASGSITVGDSVGTALSNLVVSNRATSVLSGAKCLGIAMETATDGEEFVIEIRPTIMNSTL